MDLQTINQELNKRFAEPLPEFYKRRIVIWKDEEGEFADQIDDLALFNAKVLRLTETNNFAIKKIISVEKIFEASPSIELDERKLKLFLNGVMLTQKCNDGVYKIYSHESNNINQFIGTGTIKDNLLKRDIIL